MITAFRQKIGISLVLVGITISMFLNYFLPITYWTPFVMGLSCLLLCDRTTFEGTTYFNEIFKYILAFQLIMLCYFFLSFNEELAHQIKGKLLSFHLYIICLAFILMRTPSLRNVDFLPCLFVISSLVTILSSFCHFTGLIEMDRMINKENSILEVFTCNAAAFVNFSASLLLLCKSKKWLFPIYLIMIFLDFYVIMQSAKRSFFVSVLAVAILFLYKVKQLKKGLIISFITILLLVIFIPQIWDLAETFIERTIDGFSTVFFDKKSASVNWDDSASVRAWSQGLALQKFHSFGILNCLFGGGYYFWFFDNPLGESYLDMGLIGLFFYTYIVVYIPFKFYRKCSKDSSKELMFFFMALMNICIILTNNDPYNYINYTPICMIALFSYEKELI